MDYDLFNGDADGICSLIQLRLAEPREAELVTGIKRDIELLDQIDPKSGDRITVLDLSMKKNLAGLSNALKKGAQVLYVDHHQSGDIPIHDGLKAHINTSPATCTALIVNHLLQGKYQDWAIVAAYGDNITQVADTLAKQAGYNKVQKNNLRQLGIGMNYNGYGASIDDLFYSPDELFRIAVQYESPFDMIEERGDVYLTLTNGYREDLRNALKIAPYRESHPGQEIGTAIMMLPNEKWSRRISGVLGNELANLYPNRAHAILTIIDNKKDDNQAYSVSLRAPKSNPIGAFEIATKFGGGGRAAAAGIDILSHAHIDNLEAAIVRQYL